MLGTKENIEYIKKELSSEEKFLESIIKAEKFYKKYKKPLIGLAAAAVILALGYVGWQMKAEHDLEVSNRAYTALLQNPQDKEALEILKSKNPKLYQLYLYQRALKNKDVKTLEKLAQSGDYILQDLSRYHIGVIKKEEKMLSGYALQKDAVLRDYAVLDSSYLDYEKGEIGKAHKRLDGVDKNSPAYALSLLLRHYGVAK